LPEFTLSAISVYSTKKTAAPGVRAPETAVENRVAPENSVVVSIA